MGESGPPSVPSHPFWDLCKTVDRFFYIEGEGTMHVYCNFIPELSDSAPEYSLSHFLELVDEWTQKFQFNWTCF